MPILILFQFNVGLGMPISLEGQSLTMGILIRWIYPLPSNSTIFVDPYAYLQKRSTPLSTRWDMYTRMETIIDRYEIDKTRNCSKILQQDRMEEKLWFIICQKEILKTKGN